MSNKLQMLAAIQAGELDDATVSATLDAIVEQDRCSLFLAVSTLYNVHRAGVAARELREAVGYLAKGSPDKAWLEAEIAASAAVVPDEAMMQVVVVDGDEWPCGKDVSLWDGPHYYPLWTVTVGAGWVVRTVKRQRDGRTVVNKRARRHKAQ